MRTRGNVRLAVPLGGYSTNRGERSASWYARKTAPSPVAQENGPQKKDLLHSESARLFFDGNLAQINLEHWPFIFASAVEGRVAWAAAVSATNECRQPYWLPAAGLPAFRMEEAAAKMRAAL